MSDIYEDAYLTIAIALAQGDDVGFLHREAAREEYTSQSVDLCDFGVERDNIRVRAIHDHRTVSAPQPLTTRAWTMQESMLSPRVLEFSVAVSFECRQSNFCECGSGMFPDPFCADISIFKQASRRTYTKKLENVYDPERIYDYWAIGIVTPYSDRKLTYEGDRLPALSALASKFAQKLDDKYLAGLWERDLCFSINWESDDLGQNLTTRAPSWSWASIEGPVTFGKRVKDSPIPWSLLEAEVHSSQGGLVQRGLLRIAGWTCWAWLQIEWRNEAGTHPHFDCKYSLTRQDHGYKDKPMVHDNKLKGPFMKLDTPISTMRVPSGGEGFTIVRRLNDQPGQFRRPVSGFVLCLLLHEIHKWKGQEAKRRFIMLGASSDTQGGVYQRVGMMSANQEDVAWFHHLERHTVVIE